VIASDNDRRILSDSVVSQRVGTQVVVVSLLRSSFQMKGPSYLRMPDDTPLAAKRH
jgi:hypothetical protein